MILHVVLFTPREGLTAAELDDLGHALDSAFTTIASVRAFRVGKRVRTGAAYDATSEYDFCAIVEFADLDGLREYLKHPAHAELGRLFYTTSQRALAADFDAVSDSPSTSLHVWSST